MITNGNAHVGLKLKLPLKHITRIVLKDLPGARALIIRKMKNIPLPVVGGMVIRRVCAAHDGEVIIHPVVRTGIRLPVRETIQVKYSYKSMIPAEKNRKVIEYISL